MLGVATLAGRKSILKLAQRMTWSFCHAIGASSFHTWTMVTSKTGEDIRISSRKNLNDPGEPLGVILSAVSSVWLPVSTNVLFDFLRDEARRSEVQLSASLLFFFFFLNESRVFLGPSSRIFFRYCIDTYLKDCNIFQ